MNLASHNRRLGAPSREQGMVLVMVLVILTIVTIVGLTAMRAGLLDAAIGTNAQVNMLTFQSSDSGFAAVEDTIADEAATNPAAPTAAGGILSMAADFERIVCLKKTGLKKPDLPTGQEFCDPTATGDSDFMSPRNAAMVQVAIINPSDTTSSPRPGSTGSDDSALPGGGSMMLRVISTSVLPNYGNATKLQIKDCLHTRPNDDTSDPSIVTVTDCLASVGASFTTLVQEYSYEVSP